MRKIVLEIEGADFLDRAIHQYDNVQPVYASRKVIIFYLSLNERRASIGYGSTSEGGDGSQFWPLLTIHKGRKVGTIYLDNLPGWDVEAFSHDRGLLSVVMTRGL